MAAFNAEMQGYNARLQTFLAPHQVSKRRASSQSTKKKGGSTIEWPHQQPAAEDLARAGFFYRPAHDSPDNVQCFFCSVKLDGWEPADDPFKEHLAHAATCQWAISVHAGRSAQEQQDNAPDPMGDELLVARRATFEQGSGWPHESKRAWKCKISKMVEAGWCLDPAPVAEGEEVDGTSCFYCGLSLDGWEPKDDPFQEHKRRSPDCAFFALVEKFGSGDVKAKKGKAKGKGMRGSTASKASRLSTQSTFSEAPSAADSMLGTDMDVAVDDSVVTTASQATVLETTKPKKGGRTKAPSKGAKGRKRANTVDSEADAGVVYPALGSQVVADVGDTVAHSQPTVVDVPPPAKTTRKGAQSSKQPQQLDSSVVEISSFDVAPPAKKASRGRKAKAEAEPDRRDSDHSEVSAQLQEELERSMNFDIQAQDSMDVTPQPEAPKPKRGVKRTSDGVRKKQPGDAELSSALDDFPVPPTSEPRSQPTKAVKPKKAPVKKGGNRRTASSTRSSRSSKATVIAESDPVHIREESEDLERDEREIEAELQRIADEQKAIEAEQDKVDEYETSPSHPRKSENEVQKLEEQMRAAEVIALASNQNVEVANLTPSPSGSDKENHPSSVIQPKSSTKAQTKQPMLSPTKTSRIPLAPGTPNRLLLSPSKRNLLSPSKQIPHLVSSQPWAPVDLDTVLLASPLPTPNTLAQRLANAASGKGMLSNEERHLTVEQWVKFQADKGERELRRKCEEAVAVFEREGNRAMGALGGIAAQA